VTLCSAERRSVLGKIEDGSIVLSRIGEIIQEYWLRIPEHFPTVLLDEYAIMPNHFHGILFLTEEETGTIYRAPTREGFGEQGIVSNDEAKTPNTNVKTGTIYRAPTREGFGGQGTISNDEAKTSNTNVKTGTIYRAPTTEGFGKPVPASLPTIVRIFKAAVTREAREKGLLNSASLWQRGYYEHVIRCEKELYKVSEYIIGNPVQWEFDKENPDRL